MTTTTTKRFSPSEIKRLRKLGLFVKGRDCGPVCEDRIETETRNAQVFYDITDEDMKKQKKKAKQLTELTKGVEGNRLLMKDYVQNSESTKQALEQFQRARLPDQRSLRDEAGVIAENLGEQFEELSVNSETLRPSFEDAKRVLRALEFPQSKIAVLDRVFKNYPEGPSKRQMNDLQRIREDLEAMKKVARRTPEFRRRNAQSIKVLDQMDSFLEFLITSGEVERDATFLPPPPGPLPPTPSDFPALPSGVRGDSTPVSSPPKRQPVPSKSDADRYESLSSAKPSLLSELQNVTLKPSLGKEKASSSDMADSSFNTDLLDKKQSKEEKDIERLERDLAVAQKKKSTKRNDKKVKQLRDKLDTLKKLLGRRKSLIGDDDDDEEWGSGLQELSKKCNTQMTVDPETGRMGKLKFDLNKLKSYTVYCKKGTRLACKGICSPGLYNLLTGKHTGDVTDQDIKDYRSLVQKAEIHLPLVKDQQKNKQLVMHGRKNPKKKSTKIKVLYYKNLEQLVDEMELLMGSLETGNNSPEIVEEILQIADILKDEGEMSQIQYAHLVDHLV